MRNDLPRGTLIPRILSLLILIVLVFSCSVPLARGCKYYQSPNDRVPEGEEAYYYIRVENNDRPQGVTIRFTVHDPHGRVRIEHEEFHLALFETNTTYFHVNTSEAGNTILHTSFTGYERNDTETEYRKSISGHFETTVYATGTDEKEGFRDGRSNVFLAMVGVSILSIVLSLFVTRNSCSFPLIRGYSRLMRKRLLDHPNRNLILTTVVQHPGGLPLSEIQRTCQFRNSNLVRYHLKRLMEFNLIKKIGTQYYPAQSDPDISLPLRIEDARRKGFRTPSEIARHIGSYRQKVWYYLKR